MRKLLLWVAVILAGYLVITHPGSSADVAHQTLAMLRGASEGLASFVSAL